MHAATAFCPGLISRLGVAAGLMALAAQLSADAAPPIRLSAENTVPACVTPDRLMRFLRDRNPNVPPRMRDIADHYRRHGMRLRVRWDYAFFQMALETNFLTFRRPGGGWGDVKPAQNNFAGIGATGGGVPGNAFPDVSTGVLAQIQHLVVYTGERLDGPVAPRTRLKQDDIIAMTRSIAARRPVTFGDLAGRWAVDRRYGRSIDTIAGLFRQSYCRGQPPAVASASGGGQVTPPIRKPDSPGQAELVDVCQVRVAGDSGAATLLIRSRAGTTLQLTALDVDRGREREMERRFIRAHAAGGRRVGVFGSRDAALERAHALCREATARGGPVTTR